MTCRAPSEHNKTRSGLNAVTKRNSGSELNPPSKVNSENSPAVPNLSNDQPPPSKWPIHDPLLWTRKLREVKDVIRVPVDNFQLATLATIISKRYHRDSVDDNDENEWMGERYEYKSRSTTEGSSLRQTA